MQEEKEIQESIIEDIPVVEEEPSKPDIDYTDSLKVITDFIESYEKEQSELKEIKFEVEDKDFKDPTPNDPVTKEDILIYYQTEENGFVTDNQKELESLNKSLTTVKKDMEEDSEELILVLQDELFPKLDSIIENQNTLLENQGEQLELDSLSSGTLVSYATVYIPLAIICFLLWRFFSTFLRAIR